MALTKGHARNAAKTPLDQRLADMALVTANADGSPRPGVLSQSGADLLTALPTMHVAVAAAEFVTSKGKSDGVMIFTNDGVVNVPIAAAPASNSRIDVIWVKHNDNTTGDATSTPAFGVTDGVAAASPTKPAIPTGALELGTLRVYAGTTAANGGANVLTNTYAMTALRGAPVPFRNLTELSAWTPAEGALAYQIDAKITHKRIGTAWVPWDSDWLTASTGISASSGAINDGRASHRYKYASGAIIDTIAINITNAGTGSGALNVEMPFTVAGTWVGIGRSEIDGSQLQVRVQGNSATVFKYNNTSAIAVGAMYLTVMCGLT